MVGYPVETCPIVLQMAEDAYAGDAQFTVSVDGQPVGGIRTVTASHAAGQTQAFPLPDVRCDTHTVSIRFLNDAYGGSRTKDRNLYVESISIGRATIDEKHEQASNGVVDYRVSPPPLVSIAAQDLAQRTSAGSPPVSASGALTLTGTLVGAAGTKVIVYDANGALGMATVESSGAWHYSAVLPVGSYALHVVATDPNGSESVAAAETAFEVRKTVSPSLAHPFRADSPWNTALGPTARYQSEGDLPTSSLLSGATPWIGPNTVGLYQATVDDPLATWTYDNAAGLGASGHGAVQIRTPSGVRFLGGTDQLAVIVSPDHKSYYEVWLGRQGAAPLHYDVNYMVKNTVDGTGFSTAGSPAHGIRAAGSSMLAGLVQTRELDELDIPHALAMTIALEQAAAGATAEKQYVFPATGADSNSVTTYTGTIPIGTRFAIPAGVDLGKIGLKTPEGLALASAYQRYGGYAVDTAPQTDVLASIETGARTQQVDHLMQDVGTIRSHLRAVVSDGRPSAGPPSPTPAETAR